MSWADNFSQIQIFCLQNIHLPAKINATSPTLSAFKEMRPRMAKTIGRITALLNLRANKIGNASFFSFPRASAERKKESLHKFQAIEEFPAFWLVAEVVLVLKALKVSLQCCEVVEPRSEHKRVALCYRRRSETKNAALILLRFFPTSESKSKKRGQEREIGQNFTAHDDRLHCAGKFYVLRACFVLHHKLALRCR